MSHGNGNKPPRQRKKVSQPQFKRIKSGNNLYKSCSICNLSKPYTDFHANRTKADGRESACKYCALARKKQRRADTPKSDGAISIIFENVPDKRIFASKLTQVVKSVLGVNDE